MGDQTGPDFPELALFGLWSYCPLTPLVALLAPLLGRRELEGLGPQFQSLGAWLHPPQEGRVGRHLGPPPTPALEVSLRWTSLALPASRPLPANQIRGLPGEGAAGRPGAEERGRPGPSANTAGARPPSLSGLCGCFLKLESTWENPGIGQGGGVGDGPAGAEELERAVGVSAGGLCVCLLTALCGILVLWRAGVSGWWCTTLCVCVCDCVSHQEADAGPVPRFPAGAESSTAKGLKGTMAVTWGRPGRVR